MLQEIFLNIINVSITTSILIGIIILMLPLFRKNYSAKWRYWVWLIIAVRLVIPFNLSIHNPPIEIATPAQSVDIKLTLHKPASIPASHYLMIPQTVKDTGTKESIPITGIFATIWLSGFVLFILYYIGGYIVFRNSIKRFIRPVEENRVIELFNKVKKELKVTRNIRVYYCKKGISPMMTGFFNPVLILPELELDKDYLGLILKHELIHYMRKDIWYKALLLLANGIHWFNPLVYLMKNLSEKDLEMVCDTEIIKEKDITFKRKYSETIILAIHNGRVHNTAFSTYIHGGKKTMKKRFANIFDNGKKKQGIVSICFILAAVCLIGSLVACKHKENAPEDTNSTIDTSDNSGSGNKGAKKDNQIIYGDNRFGASEQVDNQDLPEIPNSTDETDSADSEDNTVPITVTGNNGYKGIHTKGVTDTNPTEPAKTGSDVSETSGNTELNSDGNSSDSDTMDGSISKGDSIIYNNNQYGFEFTLPSSWKGYTILTDKWEGVDFNESQKVTETGPLISIRHPLWTSGQPRQDIPIMIFTLSQWEAMQQDKFHIGAAPINPDEFGRNSNYVFALPARYNFAYPAGFEEVEEIMENAPLTPTENITSNK
ncbi:M56 family metallopeptidase [Anaerocolumna sp. MB42-C2]|uniref:M56 family metallopeptidase n=1 Tax=Anaerocolumna sp. MB42-C2 TaxID=3070997 RepID=UPI0027E0D6BF|nr:M56 family metallopeptidase [Anaerocolumna sp. MB42-C2]WMJ88631.1 M56 family metallopeptidase [Anaerocolumna sp. MB42-C2]